MTKYILQTLQQSQIFFIQLSVFNKIIVRLAFLATKAIEVMSTKNPRLFKYSAVFAVKFLNREGWLNLQEFLSVL